MECWKLLGNFHWSHIQAQQISYGCCIHIHKIQGNHIHGPSAQHEHKQSHNHDHNHILAQQISSCNHAQSHIRKIHDNDRGPGEHKIVHVHGDNHIQAQQISCGNLHNHIPELPGDFCGNN